MMLLKILLLSTLISICFSANPCPTSKRRYLDIGDTLYQDQGIYSDDGHCVLCMQGDGNLVVYEDNVDPKFASNTFGQPDNHFSFQNDGNLVVIQPDGNPVWALNSFGLGGVRIYINNDCYVILLDKSGNIIQRFA